MACNPRNPRPAAVFNNQNQHIDVYGDDVEVDYRGYEVTVENFVRLLTGRLPESTPRYRFSAYSSCQRHDLKYF